MDDGLSDNAKGVFLELSEHVRVERPGACRVSASTILWVVGHQRMLMISISSLAGCICREQDERRQGADPAQRCGSREAPASVLRCARLRALTQRLAAWPPTSAAAVGCTPAAAVCRAWATAPAIIFARL